MRASIELLICRRYSRNRRQTVITVYNRVKTARYTLSDSVRVSKFKTVFDKVFIRRIGAQICLYILYILYILYYIHIKRTTRYVNMKTGIYQ